MSDEKYWIPVKFEIFNVETLIVCILVVTNVLVMFNELPLIAVGTIVCKAAAKFASGIKT